MLPLATQCQGSCLAEFTRFLVSNLVKYVKITLTPVSAPDHLAGILFSCLDKPFLVGARFGLFWSVGHGISTAVVALGAYFLKTKFVPQVILAKVAGLAPIAVGISLILIGVFGVSGSINVTQPVYSFDSSRAPTTLVAINGFFHGFSLDGFFGLIPLLTSDSALSSLIFLLSYVIGTAIIMSLAAGLMGYASQLLSNSLDLSIASTKFSHYISFSAIALGSILIMYNMLLKI
jgi:hypothetical protein